MQSRRGHVVWSIVIVVLYLPGTVFAWSGPGHKLIGRLAERLIEHTPAAQEVHRILRGLSLQDAAVWADCAKGIDPTHAFAYVERGKYPECAVFETAEAIASMRGFVQRNQGRCSSPTASACHKQYHYTDVALYQRHYDRRLPGTRADDVVAATVATLNVLAGKTVTPPIAIADRREALLLLTHYVGDLHQPLHVGAVYLDAQGRDVSTDASMVRASTDTKGGNRLRVGTTVLHRLWDEIPESLSLPGAQPTLLRLARAGAGSEGSIFGWPAQWADDTLKCSEKAYAGLRFSAQESGIWSAHLPVDYDKRRVKLQTFQLTKAAARLAALLRALWPA